MFNNILDNRRISLNTDGHYIQYVPWSDEVISPFNHQQLNRPGLNAESLSAIGTNNHIFGIS